MASPTAATQPDMVTAGVTTMKPPPGTGLPTPFANRFIIYASPDVTRIVFSDAVIGTEGVPHSAVMLRTSDALQLANSLIELVGQLQKAATAEGT